MKCLLIVFSILLVSCSKKITTVEIIQPEPGKKAIYAFKLEEPKKVETPTKPMEQFKQCVIVYFPFDSYDIPQNEKFKLSNIELPVELVGGACPIGSDDYNYTLGLNRAYSVKHYFDKNGVEVKTVKSNGENNLVTEDKSEYWKNRRVEVRY